MSEVRDWVDAVYEDKTEQEREDIALALTMSIEVTRVSELRVHIERKYWNLPRAARSQILRAYAKSSRRDPAALLTDYGVFVEDHVPSDKVKGHIFQ